MSKNLVTFLARELDKTQSHGPDSTCPDDNTWAQLADGLLNAEERDHLLQHVAHCATCRQRASTILEDMDEASLSLPPTSLIPSDRPTIFAHPARYALAAAAMIVLGVGLYWGLGGRPERGFGVDATAFVMADASLPSLGYELDGRVTRSDEAPPLDEDAYHSAIATLQPHLDRDEPPAEALALATRAALSARFSDDAAGYAERWTSRDPEDAAAWNALGLARFRQKRFAEALAAFEQAVSRRPEEPTFHLNAALAADQADEIDQAIVHLERFLELNPAHPLAVEARSRLDDLRQP